MKRIRIGPKSYDEALARKKAKGCRIGDYAPANRLRRSNLARSAPVSRPAAKQGDSSNRGRIVAGAKRSKRRKGLRRRVTETDRADAAFSLMIREAANWLCARCGADHSEHHETLDCSHYFRRNKYSVRYDPDNADALCHLPCHVGEPNGWEFQKNGGYLDFMHKKLGYEGFADLQRQSETRCKLSDARAAFWETQGRIKRNDGSG